MTARAVLARPRGRRRCVAGRARSRCADRRRWRRHAEPAAPSGGRRWCPRRARLRRTCRPTRGRAARRARRARPALPASSACATALLRRLGTRAAGRDLRKQRGDEAALALLTRGRRHRGLARAHRRPARTTSAPRPRRCGLVVADVHRRLPRDRAAASLAPRAAVDGGQATRASLARARLRGARPPGCRPTAWLTAGPRRTACGGCWRRRAACSARSARCSTSPGCRAPAGALARARRGARIVVSQRAARPSAPQRSRRSSRAARRGRPRARSPTSACAASPPRCAPARGGGRDRRLESCCAGWRRSTARAAG